jgi:hypothetical protein
MNKYFVKSVTLALFCLPLPLLLFGQVKNNTSTRVKTNIPQTFVTAANVVFKVTADPSAQTCPCLTSNNPNRLPRYQFSKAIAHKIAVSCDNGKTFFEIEVRSGLFLNRCIEYQAVCSTNPPRIELYEVDCNTGTRAINPLKLDFPRGPKAVVTSGGRTNQELLNGYVDFVFEDASILSMRTLNPNFSSQILNFSKLNDVTNLRATLLQNYHKGLTNADGSSMSAEQYLNSIQNQVSVQQFQQLNTPALLDQLRLKGKQ